MTSKDTQSFNEKVATDTGEAASIASEDEHNTSTMQAFKQYLWGLVFGHRNVYSDRYEHYDGILISNLIAYPLLKKYFSTYYPGLDQYVVAAIRVGERKPYLTCTSGQQILRYESKRRSSSEIPESYRYGRIQRQKSTMLLLFLRYESVILDIPRLRVCWSGVRYGASYVYGDIFALQVDQSLI
jgi:hypothetical protein